MSASIGKAPIVTRVAKFGASDRQWIVLDQDSGEWFSLPELPDGFVPGPGGEQPLVEPLQFLADGRNVAVWNGGFVAMLDEDRKSWLSPSEAPIEPTLSGAACLVDGRVFVWGGSAPAGQIDQHATDAGAVYDSSSGRWALVAPGPLSASSGPTAMALADSRVWLAGGIFPTGLAESKSAWALLDLSGQ